MGILMSLRAALRVQYGAPEWAARQAIAGGDPDAGFALLDELLAEGTGDLRPVYPPHAPSPVPVAPAARPAERSRLGQASDEGPGLWHQPVR
jgi:hypothetical protein